MSHLEAKAIRALYFASALFLATSTSAQGPTTGTPPFGTFGGGPDIVNLANLNVHFDIPVLDKAGRGTGFTYHLNYDSAIWYPLTSGSTTSWQPVLGFGWRAQTEMATGYISYDVSTGHCYNDAHHLVPYTLRSNWIYHDQFGTDHPFMNLILVADSWGCSGITEVDTDVAADGSGYTISGATNTSAPLFSSRGKAIVAPINAGTGTGSFTDRNGNKITTDGAGNFYDTLSSTTPVLTVAGSGTPSSPVILTYKSSTGVSVPYTVKYTTYSLETAFGCSGITEYGASGTTTANLISEIDGPDGSKYVFGYESTPGHSGFVTGRIATVTLPTGGTVAYSYSGGSNGITCADGSTATLTRTTPDGTWTYARSFVSGTQWQTVVTDPTSAHNQTSIQFQGLYETQRKTYQGSTSGSLLQTINTCYNAATSPCTATTITLPITQRTTLATVPGSSGLMLQHTDKFDSYGNAIESDDYDFATAAPFPLLRQTLVAYASLGNFLNSFEQKVTVKDGSGIIQSRQDTNYDEYSSFTGANCITGVPNHDDTGHGCSYTSRANITSITNYLSPSGPTLPITKSFTYDSLGNLRTAQVNCCVEQTWAYSSTTAYAYPDSVTSGAAPLQLTTSMTYDLNMGLLLTSTDPNNVQTIATYDNAGRPLTVHTGTQPSTTYTYNDYDNHSSFTPWTVTQCNPVQGSTTICHKSILDSLGRTTTVQLIDGAGTLYSAVDSQYDALGRAFKSSNPYATSPSYWTQATFDVLGRLTTTTFPDNSSKSVSYTDNTVTTTDPAGIQRKAAADGLGRLTTVFEPDPSNSNSLSLQTSYTYNIFDQVTQVTAGGTQTRTFVYDALGRLTSSTTPEAGQLCYGTVSGSYCAANGYDAWNNVVYRTDARGVVTNYLYDSLNRLVGITYPTVPAGVAAMPNVCKAGTSTTNNANVCFAYGTSPTNYNNGRRTTVTDALGSATYAFDQYGNISQLARVIGTTTYTTSYQYNFASQLTQITYPSGRVVAQNRDAIGRLSSVVGTMNSVQTTYLSGISYNAAAQVSSAKFGNNIYASYGFSPDTMFLQCLDYSTTNRTSCVHDATTKFGLNYAYPASPGNNGEIASITDYVDNGRSSTYTYDALYRLTNAATAGSAAYPAWGLAMVYDRFGNKTAQTISSGCVSITCPTPSTPVNSSTNQITGMHYDASGNTSNDGNNTLVYDGEHRATSATNSATSGTYSYDGTGLRVGKTTGSNTTVYVYSGSQVLAEYDNGAGVTSPSREYIYTGSTPIAKIDATGTTYYHRDHLSNRLTTDASGSVVEQIGTFPYGESWYSTAGDKLLFTSYERDAESGEDYAMSRYYLSRFGRFESPDQLSGTIFDPQSLNRYAYVGDNPINLTDPFGRECVWDDGSFDSSSDPESGSAQACGDLGGTWVDIGGTMGDWSPTPNQGLANLVAYMNSPQTILVFATSSNVDTSATQIGGQLVPNSGTSISAQPPPPAVKHCKLLDVLRASVDSGFAVGFDMKGFGSKIGVSWFRSVVDDSLTAEFNAKILTIGFEDKTVNPTGDWEDSSELTQTNEFKYGPYRYDFNTGRWSRRKATLSGDLFKSEYGLTAGFYRVSLDLDKWDKYIKSHGCDVID